MIAVFRAAGQRWLAEADELDAWADQLRAECGGRDIFLTQSARLRASLLRLGAAYLGQSRPAART